MVLPKKSHGLSASHNQSVCVRAPLFGQVIITVLSINLVLQGKRKKFTGEDGDR